MPTIEFTDILRRFFPALEPVQADDGSLYEIVTSLEERYPGLRNYLLDDQGNVRKHVAVAVNGTFIREKKARDIPLTAADRVLILQALSGG